jgi:DNA polymerase-1
MEAFMPARLFLIDSFNFIFRAYYARARSSAPPMRTATGIPTEAVYIFHNMVRKLMNDYQPEYLAAVFESSDGKSFRDTEFAAYKANRTETPNELLEQIPWVRRTLGAMGVPVIEAVGFEADDVIGTLATIAGMEVVIVSSDKDMLQLVDDRVRVLNPMKDNLLYDADSVRAYMGVDPPQVRDLLALKGDAVDNIPGAPGIGDKGAKDLILRFGSVEAALDHAAEVEKKTYRESLLNHREQILLSKRLATIACDIPLEISVEQLVSTPPNLGELRDIYRTLEFFSLLAQTGAAEEEAPPVPEDFGAFLTADEAREWLRALPEGPVAVVLEGGTAAVSTALGVARSFDHAALDALSRRPLRMHNWKAAPFGAIEDVTDLLLTGFLLLADPGDVDLPALSERFLHRKLGPSLEARAAAIFELAPKLDAELAKYPKLVELYEKLDRPLIPILAAMEKDGITVDRGMLKVLSERMDQVLAGLTAEIHALAGREFNNNSPQQLGKVLFEELNLPAPFKAGKGKVISTAADVLETLAAEHRIALLVLEYRQVSKLKGTYVDALPALMDPESRVHTTFNPAGAATGRLSSNNPNLQNIPIRTELGREIRAAFIPRPGWILVKADYSQIELRLLAHFSADPVLTDSFVRGEDIHTRTAAEVFGVPPLMVTPEHRRNAKAVNFGIVYGQTSFGLAASLGISRSEADTYIKNYFQRYAGVKKHIERTIAEVRKTGYAETLFGRRRPIPDMSSKNPNARGFAERTAVNTPLQGTAADLIKLAMIHIAEELAERNWQSRLLLQVHDELVFEAPPEEAPQLAKMVKQKMEAVHKLNVPLIADASSGPNWRDAK